MTSHYPNDHRSILKTKPRSRGPSWIIGAIALLAVLGVLLWSMSNDDSSTARTGSDINTGTTAGQIAPPAGAPTGTGPGTPSRP